MKGILHAGVSSSGALRDPERGLGPFLSPFPHVAGVNSKNGTLFLAAFETIDG